MEYTHGVLLHFVLRFGQLSMVMAHKKTGT